MSDANRFRCLHILIDTDPHGADLSNTVDATTVKHNAIRLCVGNASVICMRQPLGGDYRTIGVDYVGVSFNVPVKLLWT
jgi:hypothetical protein